MVHVNHGHLALFDIVRGISRIGLHIWIGSPKIRVELAFCDPTSVSTPKIQFPILKPRPKMRTRLNFSAPAWASSAATGNENPLTGLDRDAISPDSSIIRQSYESF
ncbi:hypothetical protein TNCV_1614871 [Trichonephila clavipes]|nr:hypothetical protein TNCV_1614871 [Trichonephila clavipes]